MDHSSGRPFPNSSPGERLTRNGYITCHYLTAKAFGINEAILLEYLVGWGASNPDQWCYRTAIQIEGDTCLTSDQQRTARAKLKAAGIISESLHRADSGTSAGAPVVHFHVDWRRVEDAIQSTEDRRPKWIVGKPQMENGNSPKALSENPKTIIGIVNGSSQTKESENVRDAREEAFDPFMGFKRRLNLEGFPAFWHDYPVKTNAKKAQEVWHTLSDADRTLAGAAIKAQITWPSFVNRDPEKIPHAANWLADERWTDERPPDPAPKRGKRPMTLEEIMKL